MSDRTRHNGNGKRWDRRRFLTALGLAGIGVTATGTLRQFFDVSRFANGLTGVTRKRTAMGTFVSITGAHESRSAVVDAIGVAFEEMDRLIAIFSRHDSSAALATLNRDGRLDGAPGELFLVMDAAASVNQASGGAFDPTVAPLVDALLHGGPVDAEMVEKARELVGLERVQRGGGNVRFERAGMAVTLDSIAKGYIADRMSDLLLASGVECHLVDAGGDIRARGGRGGGRPWRIAVADPALADGRADAIEIVDGAVATSGNYEVSFRREPVTQHLVNPLAMRDRNRHAGVSVVAPSAMIADALSTTAFVLPGREAGAVVESFNGCGALFIDTDGSRVTTRRWQAARA